MGDDLFLAQLQLLCAATGTPWGMLQNTEKVTPSEPFTCDLFEGSVNRGLCAKTGEPWFGVVLKHFDGDEPFALVLARTVLADGKRCWMARQSQYEITLEDQYDALGFLVPLLHRGSVWWLHAGEPRTYVLR